MSDLRLTGEQAAYLRAQPLGSHPNRIRQALRLVDGANQQTLAEALGGMSQAQLSRYLNGRDLLLSTAHAIAAVFGLTVTDLFPVPPVAKAKRRKPQPKASAKGRVARAPKTRKGLKAAA